MNYPQKVTAVVGILVELFLLFVRPAYWRDLADQGFRDTLGIPVQGDLSLATIEQINEESVMVNGEVFEVVQATDLWIGAMGAVALFTLLGIVVFSDSDSQ
jgi:hypothetical protein